MPEPAPGPPQPPAAPRRWGRRAAVAAASVVALVALCNAHVIASTRGMIASGVDSAPTRPVAIVLGNRVYPDGTVGDTVGERLEVALRLFRAGRAGRVVVSGAVWPGGYDEPKVMAAWLVARGVPAARVTMDRGGHRTAATMADAAAAGIRSALICTHGYHLTRALYLAHHAGIDAVGVPADDSEGGLGRVRIFVREALARAETVVEVAVRGVKAR